MRFMMLVKASQDSEAGVLPSKELLAAMGQFNDCLLYTSPSPRDS